MPSVLDIVGTECSVPVSIILSAYSFGWECAMAAAAAVSRAIDDVCSIGFEIILHRLIFLLHVVGVRYVVLDQCFCQ